MLDPKTYKEDTFYETPEGEKAYVYKISRVVENLPFGYSVDQLATHTYVSYVIVGHLNNYEGCVEIEPDGWFVSVWNKNT